MSANHKPQMYDYDPECNLEAAKKRIEESPALMRLLADLKRGGRPGKK